MATDVDKQSLERTKLPKQAIAIFCFFLVFEVFAKVRRKNSISLIVWTPWHVREVESYALSKFQTPMMRGDSQNVEKTIRKKFDFFWSLKSVFHHLDVWARSGSRELRAVKLPASCDAWQPPKHRKYNSEKNRFFGISEISFS